MGFKCEDSVDLDLVWRPSEIPERDLAATHSAALESRGATFTNHYIAAIKERKLPLGFKYEDSVDHLDTCPPDELNPVGCTAFRWVHEDLNSENNYLPPAKISPSRLWRSDAECCAGHALSFFSTQNAATRRFRAISKRHKNFYKTVGTRVAKVELVPADGLVTRVASNGHFELYEDDQCSFAGRLHIVPEVQLAAT